MATTQISVEIASEEWLYSAREDWTRLVADSEADPLFMGWIWQCTWWKTFGKAAGGTLAIILLRDATGDLVGIAPFFRVAAASRVPRLRSVRQFAALGNVWRMRPGEVTEYNDWIVRRSVHAEAANAVMRFIGEDAGWDEILLSFTAPDSVASRALTALAATQGWYVRHEAPLRHYSIVTDLDFEQFTTGLGRNTRTRLLRRRALLHSLGRVEIVHTDSTNLASQLDKLDRLLATRWGRGFTPLTRSFYEQVCGEFLASGQLQFSTLEVDGRPLSALLDVQAGAQRYNLRLAIDPGFHARLSPGLLHIGFALEAACRDSLTTRYLLLAGGGKSADYKRDIATSTGEFSSLQIVRRKLDKLAFRFYDLLAPMLP